MDARQAELSFLKELILRSDREESWRLLRRISKVARQEQASRRWTLRVACGIAGFYVVVALTTEGWSWVWRQAEHPLAVALLWITGIALFSLLLVGGCWLWHRRAMKQLVGDTQRFLAGWLVFREPGGALPAKSEAQRRGRWQRKESDCRRDRKGGGEGGRFQ